jgi:AcrR family transcriptional regulator
VTEDRDTLRSGSFVARTTRERLLVALAELSAEQGYPETTVAQIVARADVDEATFRSHFATKEDCLLAAYDTAVDQAFRAVMRTFGSTSGTWAQAVHAALRRLLELLASTPAFTRLCLVEACHSGARILDRRQRALDMFTTFLEPGHAEVKEPCPPTRLMSELIAGGVFEIIHKHASQQQLDELPRALPAVTVLTLTPFVGSDEAIRLAEL